MSYALITKLFPRFTLLGILLSAVLPAAAQYTSGGEIPQSLQQNSREVEHLNALFQQPTDDNPLDEAGFFAGGGASFPEGSSRIGTTIVPDVLVEPGASETSPNPKFKWLASTGESLLFTGIMHAYNLGTEPGTRDTLNGHWFQHYMTSVASLRGWSDSDTFMAPYVGHTIEGSVFGFIERQNDPRYKKVQWGDGQIYFMSLLRSMAYSAVWHTQWKIGPASEASLGNVMLHASPGFITLTDTPTLGTVAMFAEDTADRYLLMGLENRTANRGLIMLARSFLNPGRTFANMMAFQVPWHRETRMGLFGENFKTRQKLLAEYKVTGQRPFEYVRLEPKSPERTLPKEAPIELTAFPLYEYVAGHNCIGGGGSGAARINPHFQVIAEVSGCLIMNMSSSNQSADSLFYGGGVRWTPRASRPFSPYMQVTFGGNKVTHETDNLWLRENLMKGWNDGSGNIPHYPTRSDWAVEVTHNGPALGIGGGFDLVLARAFAWRVLNFEYSHAWIGDVGTVHPQNSIKLATAAVLRIGTW